MPFHTSGVGGVFLVYALRIAKITLLCWGHAPTCNFLSHKRDSILQSARSSHFIKRCVPALVALSRYQVCYLRTISCACQALFITITNLCLLKFLNTDRIMYPLSPNVKPYFNRCIKTTTPGFLVPGLLCSSILLQYFTSPRLP